MQKGPRASLECSLSRLHGGSDCSPKCWEGQGLRQHPGLQGFLIQMWRETSFPVVYPKFISELWVGPPTEDFFSNLRSMPNNTLRYILGTNFSTFYLRKIVLSVVFCFLVVCLEVLRTCDTVLSREVMENKCSFMIHHGVNNNTYPIGLSRGLCKSTLLLRHSEHCLACDECHVIRLLSKPTAELGKGRLAPGKDSLGPLLYHQ